MNCSTPGIPVYHQLLRFTQTQVHWVCDAIQPSDPLWFPCPPAFNFSQHRSFQMSQFFTSCGQSIGFSASTSVLPTNIQDGFPLDWTGWMSLQSRGLSKGILQHHSSNASVLQGTAFLIVQFSHSYTTTGKTIAFTRWIFVDKVTFLLCNMLSRLVITFLPRSKHL